MVFTKTGWMTIGLMLATCLAGGVALADEVRLNDAMVADYVQTGSYNRALLSQLALARDYLDLRLHLNELQPKSEQQPLAIVVAIDNTALADEPRLRKMFVHVPVQQEVLWQSDEPVIWAFRTFYDYVLSKGVAIFFVTERPEKDREITTHNLLREGYQNWRGLKMRPDRCRLSVVAEKVQARVEIERQGYAIVLNIGSKLTDLQGGHSAKVVLLPEPDTHRARSLDGLNTLM